MMVILTLSLSHRSGGKFSAIYASKAEEHYENTFGDYHRLHSEVAKAANSRVVFLTPDGHKPAKVFPAGKLPN